MSGFSEPVQVWLCCTCSKVPGCRAHAVLCKFTFFVLLGLLASLVLPHRAFLVSGAGPLEPLLCADYSGKSRWDT